MQTFRGRVLDVPHVEVETSAIEKKASVPRWFFVISVMQIDGASVGLSKEIVFNFAWPKLGIAMRLSLAQKAAVFGFNSNDPVHFSQSTT
jgi:hypothetical protein